MTRALPRPARSSVHPKAMPSPRASPSAPAEPSPRAENRGAGIGVNAIAMLSLPGAPRERREDQRDRKRRAEKEPASRAEQRAAGEPESAGAAARQHGAAS